LHNLDVPYSWTHVDILAGETRTSEFLKLNPNGKIPVPRLDGKTCLWESNAIYPYTHVADAGGFSLDRFPAIRAWSGRIAAHRRRVSMVV
jgi:glutathione S-transferase